MLISKLFMKHSVNKFLIMLGKGIIVVYSLMDKQDLVKVTRWLVTVKIKVLFLYLSKKFLNESEKPKMKIKNIKSSSLCLKFIMKKFRIYSYQINQTSQLVGLRFVKVNLELFTFKG
jgi:hypothetical protein